MQAKLFGDVILEVVPETLTDPQWANGVFRDQFPISRVWRQLREKTTPVLLDVGAHFGAYSMLAALHTGLTVHAFEPQASARDVLRANVSVNDLEKRVHIHALALGADAGEALLHIPSRTVGTGLATLGQPMRFEPVAQDVVEIAPLDAWAEEVGLAQIDVLKIDAEGGELDILRGAETTIKRFKPFVWMEYQPENTRQFGYKPVAVKFILESWGATCRVHEKDMAAWWS